MLNQTSMAEEGKDFSRYIGIAESAHDGLLVVKLGT